MMATFDQCDTTLSCGQRDVTTVPTQALAMLNNHFVHDRGNAMARKVIGKSNNEDEQIRSAWELALGRTPSDDELKLAQAHVSSQLERFSSLKPQPAASGSVEKNVKDIARQLALASLCHVLLNSNEFLYVD